MAKKLSQVVANAVVTLYDNVSINGSNGHNKTNGKKVMRGLVDCWTVWMPSIMLYCPVCVPPGCGDYFVCFLRPVSPTQCMVGI